MIFSLNLAIIILAIIFVFIVFEFLQAKKVISREIARKGVHFFGGIIIFFLPGSVSFREAVFLGLLFTILLMLNRRIQIFKSVSQTNRQSLGDILFPFGLTANAVLFFGNADWAFRIGVLVLAISDAGAGIVGQNLGRHQYKIMTALKSLEGSATFFFLTFLIFIFAALSQSIETNIIVISIGLLFAFILTIIEGVLKGGLDNLVLPVLAAALYLYLSRLMPTA